MIILANLEAYVQLLDLTSIVRIHPGQLYLTDLNYSHNRLTESAYCNWR